MAAVQFLGKFALRNFGAHCEILAGNSLRKQSACVTVALCGSLWAVGGVASRKEHARAAGRVSQSYGGWVELTRGWSEPLSAPLFLDGGKEVSGE